MASKNVIPFAGPVMPVRIEDVKITERTDVAAGVPAVMASLVRGFKQMGPLRCTRSYLKLNQTDGFDCPSCAWPDPMPGDRSAIAEYCENGAKAVAEEATTAKAGPDFWKKHSISELKNWSEKDLGKAGRLTHPMIKKPGSDHYEPIDWDNAFRLIGDKLKSLDNPDRAVFYTSGRASNEAAFLYQLFSRMYGTNNLPDCSNMCHESTGVGLSDTIGVGKGTVKLEDFYVSDCIIIMGQNPGTNHPRMMSALQVAKRNGAKIIGVNPLPETGLMRFKNPQEVKGWIGTPTELSDLFLQVRVNADVPLMKGIMVELLRLERSAPGTVFDHDFIKKYCAGYDELIASIEQVDVEQMSKECGITVTDIKAAAKIIAESKRMIICWAMGITQHHNGVDNVKEIVNLLLLKGAMGIPGAGACPVRGHSNVQGDRTVGVWDILRPGLRTSLKKNYHFEPPTEDGYNTVKSIMAMHEGKVDVYVSLGGNMLLAGPDTEYTAEAMQRCDLTVMISTKPNRNHLVTGDTALILPCLGRTEIDKRAGGEQFISVENSMGVVHSSKGILSPISKHLISEPAIIAGIAKATLASSEHIDWQKMIDDYDHIRDAIEANIPGFTNYNQRVRNEGGFYLPNGASERIFNTKNSKANFTVVDLPDLKLADDVFFLTTIRSHDQFNTTIYGNEDRYRGVHNGRRVVFMNAKDIERHGLKDGQRVDMISQYGQDRTAPGFRIVAYDIPAGCLAAYFPETNSLVPVDQYARESYTPISKSVKVKIRPSDLN